MKSRARIPILTAAMIGLALPSCSKKEPEADPAGAETAPVVLLEQGSEPTAVLKYEVAGAPLQSSKLKVSMSMGLDYSGQAIPPETIPATSMTLDFGLSGPPKSDRFDCSVLIAGAAIVDDGSDMERLAHFNRELTHQDPVGRAGRLTRSANGQVLTVDFEIPGGATATLRHFFGNLKQALQQLAIPFPAEKVGPGARWKADLPVKISGMELTQSGDYRLVSLDGNRATVALKARCLAETQLFHLPNMPDTARCELIGLDGEAAGELTVDLTRPFPVEGNLAYRFDMRMRVMNEGKTDALNAHIEMEFDLRTP
ncbi:MAG: hypothetical protein V2A76_07255 [Planctomycetota bacterium]